LEIQLSNGRQNKHFK